MKKKFWLALLISFLGLLTAYKATFASPCSVTASCPTLQVNCEATITGYQPAKTYGLYVDGILKTNRPSPGSGGVSFIIPFPNNAPVGGRHTLLVKTNDLPPIGDSCSTSFDDNRPTPTPGSACGCVFNARALTCEDKSPSDCPPGLTCSCPSEVEVGTGIPTDCLPGKCIAPIPTPVGEDVPDRVQPTPCEVAGDSEGGIETALGCIPTKNISQLAGWILARAMAIGGGLAFLLMLWAGIQILTSTGDPKKLQAGRELLTSAITGLLMIIFAAFLLQLIGVQLFKIPGFGG